MRTGATREEIRADFLDDFQREVLAELGLQPYRLAGTAETGMERVHAMPSSTSATVRSETGAAPAITPRLLEALARAAGCDPQAVAALPGIDAACAGAAGKRALWPQLRRLRAARR
jgi:hypothetical protein